ncbi:MAG TPA: hypothetical protein VGK93_01490 [Candidatus Eisenbacteria bacterium]|jgi:hypothetical protein
MLDTETIYGWLTLATANLLVLAGAITAILKLIGTHRALRNAYRMRLARWLNATERQLPPATEWRGPAVSTHSVCR